MYPEWRALPTSTIAFTDIFDESDSLLGNDAHLKVSDGLDTTWVRQSYLKFDDTSLYLGMTADATLPQTMDSIEARLLGQVMGDWSDDGLALTVSIVKADGTTPLTDEVLLGTDPGGSEPLPEGSFALVTKPFVIEPGATDPDEWAGAQVKFHWTRNTQGALDGAGIAAAELDVVGTYTAYPIPLSARGIENTGELEGGVVPLNYVRHTEAAVGFSIDLGAHYLFTVGTTARGGASAGRAYQTFIIGLRDLENTGEINTNTILTEYILAAKPIANTGEVAAGACNTEHHLSSIGIENSGDLTYGAVIRTQVLQVSSFEIVGNIQANYVIQDHPLWSLNIQNKGDISRNPLVSEHTLGATGLENTGEIQDGIVPLNYVRMTATGVNIITNTGAHFLTAVGIRSTGEVAPASVSAQHNVLASDVEASGNLKFDSLLQRNDLDAGGIHASGAIQRGAIWVDVQLSALGLTATGLFRPVRTMHESDLSPAPIQAVGEIQSIAIDTDHLLATVSSISATGSVEAGSVHGTDPDRLSIAMIIGV